jgi:opacity protein-like surface antigen
MSLSLFVRHYWSQVRYKSYFAVNDAGKSATTNYTGNNNINFNAFNVDLAFTWQFTPGSEMSIVWKNAILTEGQKLLNNYFNDLDNTISSPQQNSFSIKVLYYLDYQNLKRRK